MRSAVRFVTLTFLSALAVLLAACGGGSGGGTVDASIELTNGGKAAAVKRIEVSGGATVNLTISSDVAETIHVHGYEVEFEVPAGGSVTKTFVADQLGSYEIETHQKAHIIAQLVVR
ncbi:MAG: hypothetical protein Q4B08_00150 [Propionibacteriaceae bacterium]|nr:hypothetical protein [Propionibacteriaceae bacterium]